MVKMYDLIKYDERYNIKMKIKKMEVLLYQVNNQPSGVWHFRLRNKC